MGCVRREFDSRLPDRNMPPEIFYNIGKKLGLEQKPKKTIFYERVGIILFTEKGLNWTINVALFQSLHQNPSSIETLIILTNDRLEDFGRKSEDYQYSLVNLQTIRKHLDYMSGYGIVAQGQDRSWTLTETGKEIADFLDGKPRTEEQRSKDLSELIGFEALDLKGDELEEFAQNRERFLPIIVASAYPDTTRPFDLSSNTELGKKIREEITRNLRQAWENFKAARDNK